MKILVVEPMKPCEVREISGLDDMQASLFPRSVKAGGLHRQK